MHAMALQMALESIDNMTPTMLLLLKALQKLAPNRIENPDQFIENWRNRVLKANSTSPQRLGDKSGSLE